MPVSPVNPGVVSAAIVESGEIRSRLERAADVVAAVNEAVSLFCIAASRGNLLPIPSDVWSLMKTVVAMLCDVKRL